MKITNRQVGATIRELRKKRGITGVELGHKTNLSQSKISKIETGSVAPKPDELKKILNILGAPMTIRQQILRSIDNAAYAFGNFQIGFYENTNYIQLDRQSKIVRTFVTNAVPAVLQTFDYRKAYLRLNGLKEEEMGENLKSLNMRQDLLWEGKPKHHILIPQAALYTVIADKPVHRAQLDRIERMLALPNLDIGIIPTEAGFLPFEFTAFAIFDDRVLLNALAHGETQSTDPATIELHLNIFAGLHALACYDDDAAALLRKAGQAFS